MDIIYKITYVPHLGTKFPKYYIGSKKNYNPNVFYMGSVASKQIFDYTDGLELRHWWKEKLKTNLEDFIFEILEEYKNINPKDLVLIEKSVHEKLEVLGEEYFNQSIATLGWVSDKNTSYTKLKKSIATRAYWASPEGILKRQRLSERNAKVKSEEMTERWKNPSDEMLNRKISGRPKGSKDIGARKPKQFRKVYAEGVIYNSMRQAAIYYNVTSNTIKRRCLLETYPEFYFVDDVQK
jgi:hypothetical protein